MKPIIGISCSMGLGISSMTQEHMPQEQHRLGDSYVQAILQAGAIPVILPSCEEASVMAAMVDRVDGILLSGGGDVDPAAFGQRATAHLGSVSLRRDRAEFALARYVVEKTEKPMLGICRGLQVMNVAFGGTLHIDLPDAGKLCHSLTMYPRDAHSHQVDVEEGSRLAQILGANVQNVNSFHHQAVDRVAEGFRVSARSIPDGVVEAMEILGERFLLGVQWHPEALIATEASQNLFRAFVEAAKG